MYFGNYAPPGPLEKLILWLLGITLVLIFVRGLVAVVQDFVWLKSFVHVTIN